jgi:DNA-binding winged helix-turn-helix (wHTH) protein
MNVTTALTAGHSQAPRQSPGGSAAPRAATAADSPSRRSRAGRIRIDPRTRELAIDGHPVRLGWRAFDLLQALVVNRDRVVTKDELLDLVWGRVVVEENNLQVHVATLRKLLGHDAIATVQRHGYRFALEPDPVRCEAARETRARSVNGSKREIAKRPGYPDPIIDALARVLRQAGLAITLLKGDAAGTDGASTVEAKLATALAAGGCLVLVRMPDALSPEARPPAGKL